MGEFILERLAHEAALFVDGERSTFEILRDQHCHFVPFDGEAPDEMSCLDRLRGCQRDSYSVAAAAI
ncbi:hypothetical protein GCM10011329_37040 [Stakelama pacifica]|nr:hypothetical protein GCM10011329_37040 [Stakelama pacifica]